MTKYSLDDLEAARAAAALATDAVGDGANNPDRGRGRAMEARARLREIEAAMRQDGTLPVTEIEQLHARLDVAFPDARSRQIVEFEGARYRRVFWPLETSRTGKTVLVWGRSWERCHETTRGPQPS